MKIVVSGGAGFIGSHVVRKLEAEGHAITIVDNLSSGNLANLKGCKAKFINHNVCTVAFKEDFDIYIHLASITDTTFPNDTAMVEENVGGFLNMLNAAKGKKLVYASSAAVYGKGHVPMKESQKLEPLNAYGVSKQKMDLIAAEYHKKLPIIGLRFFNVFGPGEQYKGKSASMIYQLWKQMQKGNMVRLFKYGEQVRDHIYVMDVADAVLSAIKCQKSGTYNVGTGIATSFNDLVKYLNEVCGTKASVEYFENNIEAVYQDNTLADTTKACQELKFETRWDLKVAIREYHCYLLLTEKSNHV